jgi:glycosyltransferase involved in cell wall biosynthesis
MVTGTGIKNKLLEAFANGLPCVATPLATQGMRVTPGRELLVGCDEQQLADHAITLLEDRRAAEALGRAARRYVVENHSWAAVGRAYEQVYEELVAQ